MAIKTEIIQKKKTIQCFNLINEINEKNKVNVERKINVERENWPELYIKITFLLGDCTFIT